MAQSQGELLGDIKCLLEDIAGQGDLTCAQLPDGTRLTGILTVDPDTDEKTTIWCEFGSTTPLDPQPEPGTLEPCADEQCPAPFNPECLVKRTVTVGYDNGFTPGSSTNDCGARENLVIWTSAYTSAGWQANGELVGVGDAIPVATPGPQLQSWADFFNLHNPHGTANGTTASAELGAAPAPAWRYAEVTDCAPDAIYGTWDLVRDSDGCVFTLHPVLGTETLEYAYRYATLDCDGNKTFVWCDAEGNTTEAPANPECFVPCGYNFGPYIEPDAVIECTAGDLVEVCEIDPGDPSDPDNPVAPSIVTPDVFVQFSFCGPDVSASAFTINADGDPIPHEITPGFYYGNCDTLEAIEEPPPPCPQTDNWQPVNIGGGWYGILDNSLWNDGATAPGNHIQNGNAYEFTFYSDGAPVHVWQQSADPYFNDFINTFPAACPGCNVLPVCANHTSPNGCNSTHLANLAMYPAYDAPTAPDDVQNNLTNPAREELWASGWLIDCGQCVAPIDRVEITASNDPAWVGVAKNITTYEKPDVLGYQAIIGCDKYFQDCDGNMIADPGCCPQPWSTNSATDLSAYETECCPTGGGETVSFVDDDNTTDQSYGIGDVDPDNPGDGIKFDTASPDLPADLLAVHAAIRACIAAGGTSAVTILDAEGGEVSLELNFDNTTEDANGDPLQFSYEGTIIDGDPSGGKIREMHATCSEGSTCAPALRTSGCLDEAILAAIEANTAKLCELVDAGCRKGCAEVSQRALLHPDSVFTYGPYVANGYDNFATVLGPYGYTVTDSPIYNADGQEIGDLRLFCITGPEEFSMSITNTVVPIISIGDVPLTFRKVNCPEPCATVEVPS